MADVEIKILKWEDYNAHQEAQTVPKWRLDVAHETIKKLKEENEALRMLIRTKERPYRLSTHVTQQPVGPL